MSATRPESQPNPPASEHFNESLLNALPAEIVALDRKGLIVAVNEPWRRFARENAGESAGRVSVGANYLEVCRNSSSSGDALAQEALEGIEAVILGRQPRFSLEYPCHSSMQQRWFLMNVTPLPETGGALVSHLDITARALADQELHLSRERLRLAAKAAHLFAFEWDAARDIVRRDGAAASILGVPSEEEPAAAYFARIHPEDRARFRDLVLGLHPGAPSYATVYRALRPDGTEVVLEESASGSFDPEGRLTHLIGMTADITARQRATDQLRESERRYRELIETAEEGVWVIDAAGKTTFANTKMGQILGYAVEEMLGRSLFDFMDAEARRQAERNMARREQGVREHHEFRFQRKEGAEVWVLIATNPLTDAQGRFSGALAMVTDITERKRAEEALRVSEERLTLATQATGYGTFDFYPQTGELIWSAQTRQHFGLPPEAPVDYGVFLQGIHAEDRQRVERVLAEALQPEGGGWLQFEYRTIGIQDGQERWIQASGRVFFDSAGQAVRCIGGTLDITRQKAFQAELERLVSERTARLQELVGELEHFSYTITHDMRAPLRSMQGYADLVMEMCAGCQKPEQQMLLQRIVAAAQRMDLLITDALSYSKAVRQDIPLGPVDVGALVQGMLETYPEFQSARDNITLEPGIPVVFGNQAALTQCFSNLIGNALKFVAPDRPPKITIRAETIPVRPEDVSNYGWVRLWVEDNGIGISEVMQPRVFNMFSRASHQFEGTGIGLALVRKVVDRMGGRVGVESELGKGSRFWIELHAYVAGQAPPPIYPKAPPGAGTIL